MLMEPGFSSVEAAVDALRQTTGLKAHVPAQPERNADLRFVIELEDGTRHEWLAEVKSHIDRRDQLFKFKLGHDDKVLVTPSLSAAMAVQCRELGLQFMDFAGNCFLQRPDFFVFVSGAKDALKEKQPAKRGLTPAALQLVLAVLTRPEILNHNIRAIASIASISHGAAGAALAVLEEMGFLSVSTTGKRLLLKPRRWLDAWTEGYLGRIRPKLQKSRMSAPYPIASLFERISPQMREVAYGGVAAALSGEGAAYYRELGLKPGTLTLYVDFRDAHVVRDLVQEFKLRRDPEGPIELIDMFWNTNELKCFPTVPDALIYADLVATGDARVMEAANALQEEICRDVESQT